MAMLQNQWRENRGQNTRYILRKISMLCDKPDAHTYDLHTYVHINKTLQFFVLINGSVTHRNFGCNSLITKNTGHTEYFEDLNSETPSVFICSDRWISFSFCSWGVPLKYPSWSKRSWYTFPSYTSSMLCSCCFTLFCGYWRWVSIAEPTEMNEEDNFSLNTCTWLY